MPDVDDTATVSLGQVAYEAYRAASDFKSLVSGERLPYWDDLRPPIRDAWRTAAGAVAAVTAAGRRD